MAIKTALKHVLKNFLKFLKEERKQNREIDFLQKNIITTRNNGYKELEKIIFELSSKITILTDNAIQLNEKIMDLTISHEELLYLLDQSEQTEENHTKSIVQTVEKKYEIN